jgi:hypothetical protein
VAFPVLLKAQEVSFIENDSISEREELFTFDSLVVDSAITAKIAAQIAPQTTAFKPNPTKAVLYSAVFPGLGQIYNRKYWKLPIVYGGFLGCAYAITWNGNQFSGYKHAYNDFTDDNPDTKSWEAYRPYSMNLGTDPAEWPEGQRTWFREALKSKREFYRRNRDLSYIATVGLYAICMIDAYVDAQLFDFDISQDLSLRIDPVITPPTTTQARTFGLQCSLFF